MNHQKEAEKIANFVENCGTDDESPLNVSLAQTHAILAVAEQLRAGNLIAIWNVGHPANTAAIFDEDRELNWPWGILAAQIAEALGIEQS